MIREANSRVTDRAMPSTTLFSAPKTFSVCIPWMASITPMANDSMATMGMARTPICIICTKTAAVLTGCLRQRPSSSQ